MTYYCIRAMMWWGKQNPCDTWPWSKMKRRIWVLPSAATAMIYIPFSRPPVLLRAPVSYCLETEPSGRPLRSNPCTVLACGERRQELSCLLVCLNVDFHRCKSCYYLVRVYMHQGTNCELWIHSPSYRSSLTSDISWSLFYRWENPRSESTA